MTALPLIAGIDEAGRGPLAGPVVAAACILPFPLFRRRSRTPLWSPFRRKPAEDCLIGDSKMLSPEQRERAFAWIVAHCHYGVAFVSAEEIDRNGILAATEGAMREAIAMLAKTCAPDELLVDGRDRFTFPYPHRSIIRGDSREPCIAAASIIAKVTRDKWMCEQRVVFPGYGFEQHKGYGTQMHQEALERLGACALHRKSFLTGNTHVMRVSRRRAARATKATQRG